MENPILEVRNVTKIFGGGLISRHQTVALENFSLTIPEGKPVMTTIAGESGSGKTTLARIILGLITPTAGEIFWRGRNIWKMSARERITFRRELQAIFQDPYQVYNPFYRVDHVFKTVVAEFNLARSREEARRVIEDALEVVGLRPEEILGKYPHQLSGGQRQRIMVARSFLLKPRLIVADEPVSMIDVSLRAMILEIMLKLKEEFGMSFLYITHDLSTAYQISDRIFILYRGSVAETGDASAVIRSPQHPYTQLLIGSIPIPDPSQRWEGNVDTYIEEEAGKRSEVGCKFYGRCPYAMEICRLSSPPLYRVGDNHQASCYLYRNQIDDH
ncbi:MAG: ABC transporter ATP-binding protein [bacterium]